MKDILSLYHSRFLETCWHQPSYRHNRVCLEHVSYPRKSIEDMVYEAQRKVILELAGKEPCVIVGRNADYILKDRDDVLNVFIHGDMPEKAQRICKLYNVTEADAINMINDTDKRRRTNYNFYTEQKWGMADNYTLSLNSSVLGYDMCQKIIMDCAKI